jgi:hypothetical protein
MVFYGYMKKYRYNLPVPAAAMEQQKKPPTAGGLALFCSG